MKVNTMLKYNFTADVYVPRINSSGQTEYVLYPVNQAVSVNIVSNRQTITMYTVKPVELGSRLLQATNQEGRLLFVEGTTDGTGEEEYEVHVHAVLPVVDIYGTITGYRSTIRRPQPPLTDLKSM